jgi:hypothetical protein
MQMAPEEEGKVWRDSIVPSKVEALAALTFQASLRCTSLVWFDPICHRCWRAPCRGVCPDGACGKARGRAVSRIASCQCAALVLAEKRTLLRPVLPASRNIWLMHVCGFSPHHWTMHLPNLVQFSKSLLICASSRVVSLQPQCSLSLALHSRTHVAHGLLPPSPNHLLHAPQIFGRHCRAISIATPQRRVCNKQARTARWGARLAEAAAAPASNPVPQAWLPCGLLRQ